MKKEDDFPAVESAESLAVALLESAHEVTDYALLIESDRAAVAAQARREALAECAAIEIVFDGPPEHVSGRFVECEIAGRGACVGDWEQRADGYWVLRLSKLAEALDV